MAPPGSSVAGGVGTTGRGAAQWCMALPADIQADLARALDRYRAAFDDAAVRAALTAGVGRLEPTGGTVATPEADVLEPPLEALAHGFAEALAERAVDDPGPWFELALALVGVGPARAPAGDPAERLPVCGALGLAAVASLAEPYLEDTLPLLGRLASDPRARVRAAAVEALRRLALRRRQVTVATLRRWLERGDLRQRVAALRALAEGASLSVPDLRGAALAAIDQLVDAPPEGAWGASAPALALQGALARGLRALAPFEADAVFAILDRMLVGAGAGARPAVRRLVASVVGYPEVTRRFPRQAAWLARRARG